MRRLCFRVAPSIDDLCPLIESPLDEGQAELHAAIIYTFSINPPSISNLQSCCVLWATPNLKELLIAFQTLPIILRSGSPMSPLLPIRKG